MGLTGTHNLGDTGATSDDNLRDIAINAATAAIAGLSSGGTAVESPSGSGLFVGGGGPGGGVVSVAGRSGAVVLTNTDVSGLGNAATKSVGTTTGTVAAGDDSRFSGGGGGTAVVSVAGRTGAVVLTHSDISGLGGSATLNVGSSGGTVAAGNDPRFANGSVSGVTMNLRDVVTPSGTNDTATVNAALATFDAGGGGVLFIPKDNWKFTGSVGLALTGTSNPIHIQAEPGCVLDFTGSSATTALLLGGGLGASAALGVSANKYDTTITCSLTVAAGDLLRIKSTDYFDTFINTAKGEIVEVLSSTSGVITLKSGLFDSYTASTTTVQKMVMPQVSVEGLTITGNSNNMGLMIQYARDVFLSRCVSTGCRERLFYLADVFCGVVQQCMGRDFWYSGTGTSYGLIIASSLHIVELGNDFKGGRHAIAHGGPTPNRDILIIGGEFDNYHPAGLPSLDFHASNEGVRLVGVTALNGMQSQASNLHADSCTFIGDQKDAIEVWSPRNCDYIILSNIVAQASGGNCGVSWYDRNTDTNTHTTGLFSVSGVIRTAGSGGYGVIISPISSSSDPNGSITRVKIDADIKGYDFAVFTAPQSTVHVSISRMDLSGRFQSTGANCLEINDTCTTLNVLHAEVITDLSAGYPCSVAAAVTDALFTDVVLKGSNSPYRSEFYNTGRTHLSGVNIVGGSSSGGVYCSGPTELLVNDLTTTASGAMTIPARTITTVNQLGNAVLYKSAAPTAGTWKVGDVCHMSVPVVGSPKGWMCTVAGTPGTWVSIGNL